MAALPKFTRRYVFQLPTEGSDKEVRPTSTINDAGDGNDLKVLGDVLLCTWNGGLVVYSVKRPGEPKLLGRVDAGKRYHSQTIVLRDKLGYLLGNNALLSYDISEPAKPKFVSAMETHRYGWSGCSAGNFLYVGEIKLDARGRQGICVYDVSTAARPREVTFVPTWLAPYHLYAVSGDRLFACLDSDSLYHSVSSDSITVPGNSALFSLKRAAQPVLQKKFSKSGGRSAAILSTGVKTYLVCEGVVFSIEKTDLKRCFSFATAGLTHDSLPYAGSTLDGAPYHGTSDGEVRRDSTR